MQRVPVEARLLKSNDEYARANRLLFRERGITAINFMSAPGAGKTSVLEKTLRELDGIFHPAVIEGDLYTTLDADRIQAIGVPAYQITTGTCCHLDARMIARAVAEFPLLGIDTLCIENVGNLVCPAEFDLGEDLRVMVYSVVEGAEKPRKYPLMFHQSHAVLLNKVDLLPYAGVSIQELQDNVLAVNPNAVIFPISCRTGQGLADWRDWLMRALDLLRAPAVASGCV